MSRVVVVSNRLPVMAAPPRPDSPAIPAGGLASAIFAALRPFPGSLWFGWTGKTESRRRLGRVSRGSLQGLQLAGMHLSQTEVDDYYHGFCNMVLWPLFHCFQGRVHIEPRQVEGYNRVQERFAAMLLPLLRPDDLLWVHDYHLLLLGRELRRQGWGGKMGFFLHIPFPAHDLWQMLPDPRGFLDAMLEYDLAGFQVEGYVENYLSCCRRQLSARWDGRRLTAPGGREQRVGVYPVGIEPGDFAPPDDFSRDRSRRGILAKVVRGRRLLLGVDRLDYTKGIPERIRAYEWFIRNHPEWRKKVSYIQIGAPSRTGAAQYQEEKRKVEALVGRVNGELAEHDWVPIRYLYRTYPRSDLARFYREADVALVTPIRDGMNLVAKEFVAAQHPESPGVLILSRCAGAAEDLPEAIVVNPCTPVDVAQGIVQALTMPLEERRRRHQALLARVRQHSVTSWGERFLQDLGESRRELPRMRRMERRIAPLVGRPAER
jgi:trehalose 6-phosphate synthase